MTLMGFVSLSHPLLMALVSHPALLRLKEIDMAGPVHYFGKNKTPPYSRFDHSLGVLALLQKANAPLVEQVCGLLHDISHTPLSHVGDLVLKHEHHPNKSYQDSVHHTFLDEPSLTSLLQQYDITPSNLIPNATQHPCLEQNLPLMCADRIEYTLHNAWDQKLLSGHSLEQILKDLSYSFGRWSFKTPEQALLFGTLSLTLCERLYGNPENFYIYQKTAKTILELFEKKILTEEQFKKGTDLAIVTALKEFSTLEETLIKEPFSQEQKSHTKAKFRGINPLVSLPERDFFLTEISEEFNKCYNSLLS